MLINRNFYSLQGDSPGNAIDIKNISLGTEASFCPAPDFFCKYRVNCSIEYHKLDEHTTPVTVALGPFFCGIYRNRELKPVLSDSSLCYSSVCFGGHVPLLPALGLLRYCHSQTAVSQELYKRSASSHRTR